jgi:riboflavin kinase / FMN adenylyltransferase
VRTFSWEEFAAGALRGRSIAATIGVFDGLHIGHRALIERVLREEGLSSVVFTFKENPKRILAPSVFQGELSTLAQKLELIETLGVESVVLIDFSGDFSKLPGRQFLSMLVGCADLRFFAVGHNFRCGHRLDTDAEGIRSFCSSRGIAFDSLPAVSWAGHPVSSSRIRSAVRDGRLEEAASMLGRPYELALDEATQEMLPAGVYAARFALAGALVDAQAELDAEGVWSLGDFGGAKIKERPARLQLLRLVSRG